MTWHPRAAILALLALAGCDHSGPFAGQPLTVGPAGTADPVRLTFNIEQDYWPTWAADGRGILYSFVNPGATGHRCVGLLPASGGTRLWEMCDNRFGEQDSVSSFTGYALGSDGRLLYVEAVGDGKQPLTPIKTTLWLADSSAPFRRTALLTLPTFIAGIGIGWLSDIAWTGPNTFIALAQGFAIEAEPQPPCDFADDSVFANTGLVVTGTISSGRAILQAVNGTTGATGYSFAEDGASIVFITHGNPYLFKVPAGGGSAVTVAPASTLPNEELFGVSCKGSLCVVANSPASFPAHRPAPCHFADPGVRELSSVSLATGTMQQLTTSNDVMVASQISPVTGDVVVQIGGNLGHIQTIKQPSNGDLYLYRGLVVR
ncbi:MAG: hypothetical protein ACREK8_07205 [Gemmatimonadales bacterium]